jgi:hypothetical protein
MIIFEIKHAINKFNNSITNISKNLSKICIIRMMSVFSNWGIIGHFRNYIK